MRVPALARRSIFCTSTLASGNGPRVVGGASEAPVVAPGVVVWVEVLVDVVGAAVPDGEEEPQPAAIRMTATNTGRLRGRVDTRENIPGPVCRETEPRAKP
jgi:hypothetical protein